MDSSVVASALLFFEYRSLLKLAGRSVGRWMILYCNGYLPKRMRVTPALTSAIDLFCWLMDANRCFFWIIFCLPRVVASF